MPIYTGRGDTGKTDLFDASRISKAAPRIEAYGTVDELNALLGTVIPTSHDDIDEQLVQIQQDLHVIQAQLADPSNAPETPQIAEEAVDRLEAWVDDANDELEPLTSFILPGGSGAGSRLHHARAVSRRAERRVVALIEELDDGAIEPVVYLNRLSDLLFTLARLVNSLEGHTERHPRY